MDVNTDRLREVGHVGFHPGVAPAKLAALEAVFAGGKAGTRCLLDEPLVRDVAVEIRVALAAAALLPATAKAIQAIAFDKSPEANWKVTWHQDLMFPFAGRVSREGFDLPTTKDGVDYARPPRGVLDELLAVRLHLDDCGGANGRCAWRRAVTVTGSCAAPRSPPASSASAKRFASPAPARRFS